MRLGDYRRLSKFLCDPLAFTKEMKGILFVVGKKLLASFGWVFYEKFAFTQRLIRNERWICVCDPKWDPCNANVVFSR